MSIIFLVVIAVCWWWISPHSNTEFIHQKMLQLSDQQEMSKTMSACFPVRLILVFTKQPYDNEFYCDVNVNVQHINSFRRMGRMRRTEELYYSLAILPNEWWWHEPGIITNLNVLKCITCAGNVNFSWTPRTTYAKKFLGFDRARLYIKYKLLKRKFKELSPKWVLHQMILRNFCRRSTTAPARR